MAYTDSSPHSQPGLMPVYDSPGLEPTTPYSEFHQKPSGYDQNAGYTNAYQQPYGYNAPYSAVPQHIAPVPVQEPREKTICGLRVVTFWLALLSGILFAAVVGTGAAFGVVTATGAYRGDCALSNPESTSSSSLSSTTPTTASESGASTPSSAQPSSTVTTTDNDASTDSVASDEVLVALPVVTNRSTPRRGSPKCPSSNGTRTEVSNTDLVFYHECGINYPGNDIGSMYVRTMEECIKLCAAQNVSPVQSWGGCRGVSWEFEDGWLGCFFKSAQGAPGYDEGIESAFLDD